MTGRRPPARQTPRLSAPEPIDPREPARLMHDRELGGLLERANVAYRSGLDEHTAFQRLEARIEPRTHAGWGWRSITVAASLSVAAGAALFIGVLDDKPSHVALGPELSPNRSRAALEPEPGDRGEPATSRAKREARLGPDQVGSDSLSGDPLGDGEDARESHDRALASEADSETGSDPVGEAVAPEVTERSAARSLRVTSEREPAKSPAEVTPPELGATPQAPRPPRVVAPVAPVNQPPGVDAPTSMTPPVERRPDCLDLAGQGEPRAAELCYAQRAAGSGLSAEAALYEMARLRRDALQDANGALAALNDYRQRFPSGSLHNEVALSRLELLSELGRGREALRESEALLASAKGQERAAELHMLRGNVFRRDLADGRAAAREYQKVEAFGGTLGAEATRLRGVSLEAAGDGAGALEAYRKYLGLPGAEKRAEVARRVEVILAKERGAGGP